MTARGFFTLLFGIVMLVTALSVGSAGALLLGAAALFAWLLAALSVLFALFSCRVTQQLDRTEARRGETCLYTLSVSLLAPLPIAPLSLRVSMPSGRVSDFLLPARLFGSTASENAFPCPHVGVFSVGALRLSLCDVFGFFSVSHAVKAPALSLCVLPVPRETEPLPTSPGEGENTGAQRAQADRTTPADTRAWQEGDDLKRVHWKLSMRRQSLMVHTYETPQRPDALVLLDLAPPPAQGAQRAALIDALTETCAGVLNGLLEAHRIARLPLSGDHPREWSGQEPQALAPMLQALAQESFVRPTEFDRVLLLASRRMRRTGSTAVLTANLTPQVADAVIALARMGPRTRVYLAAPAALSEDQAQLLHLLRTCGVEAQHIQV